MSARTTLTFANFFAAAHFFLIIYIVTPYLATFLPDEQAGLVVSLGALITLAVFPFMPELVRHYGTKRLAIVFALIQMFVLAWLSMGPALVPAILFIAVALAVSPLLAYQLDLLLEASMRKEDGTGRVRTLFLTAGNIALVLSPLVVGYLLDGTDAYWRVFAVAALTILPFLFLISYRCLPHGESPRLASTMESVRLLMRDKDLRSVVLAHGVLQLFYHMAPLFIPLYLHHVLNIPWDTLGWIIMFMLLPYVLLEYPVGWLADRVWGDKELLLAGFVVMGVGFAAIALVNESTMLLVILLLLSINRAGAAIVEAMTEGHFFRRVSEADTSMVSIFRITRPVGALLGPLVGAAFLALGGYQLLFVATGILIAILGVVAGSMIKDIVVRRESEERFLKNAQMLGATEREVESYS